MIIDSIRTFVLTCPLLNRFSKLNVDFLGVNATEYTLDSVPAENIIKKYVDGGAVKQYVFVFGSREFYGPDVLQNIDNSGFYEEFSDWLDGQSNKKELPILEGGKQALKIEALTTGYLFDTSEDNARYQVQCRLLYYEN